MSTVMPTNIRVWQSVLVQLNSFLGYAINDHRILMYG